MNQGMNFDPSRRSGYLFHLIGIIILLVTGVFGLLKAASANIGPMFLLALLPVFLALTLVPVLIYHFLALRSASYTVMRDGIILDWGLRSEEIPMPSVLWVRPARELRKGLPLPWVYWPGAVRGVRRFGGSGQIEFMASTTRNLILISLLRQLKHFQLKFHLEFVHMEKKYTGKQFPNASSLLLTMWKA
jgi:hypothetical protein